MTTGVWGYIALCIAWKAWEMALVPPAVTITLLCLCTACLP